MRGLTPVVVILSLVALGAAVWWTRSEPEPAMAPPAPAVVPAPVVTPPPPMPVLPPSPSAAPTVRELERPGAGPTPMPPSPGVLPNRIPIPQGVVTARTLLDQKDPRAALQQLDAIDVWTPEAEVLRAEAHAQLGDAKALDASLKKLKASGFVREAKALKEKLAR
jgi:hypothetical protein